MFKKVCIFSGNANPALAQEIAQVLEMPLGQCRVSRFSDGETFCEIARTYAGVDAYIIQPTCSPGERQRDGAADHGRRAAARLGRIDHRGHPVLRLRAPGPQGRAAHAHHVQARAPISWSRRASTACVCVDLHAGQIQGFFNIPFDHLYALPVFLEDYLQEELRQVGVRGLARRGRRGARARLVQAPRASLAIIDKRRERANESEVMHIIGDVNGKDCIIVDDLVDTAGTLCNAARAL